MRLHLYALAAALVGAACVAARVPLRLRYSCAEILAAALATENATAFGRGHHKEVRPLRGVCAVRRSVQRRACGFAR